MGGEGSEAGAVNTRPRASRALLAAALFGVGTSAGCKDAPGPTIGAARVTVTTVGLDLDSDGYIVSVDGEPRRAVGLVDAVTLRELATGAHTLALGGVAANCAVGGDNPRTMTVTAGDTAAVAFAVGCAPTFGIVRVTTATTGASLDADGFVLELDGGPSWAVGVSDSVLISTVPVGVHTLELQGVALNCTAGGGPRRDLTIAAGSPEDTTRPLVEVAFAVTCAPTTGSLRVTTATGGADLDADGFQVLIDDGVAHDVAANASITFAELLPGTHTVALDGVAENCVVDGVNPRPATVTAGDTADVAFGVTCAPVTGWLRVTVATTGADPDPNGYAVVVDEVCPYVRVPEDPCAYLARESVGANDSVLIAGLPAGGRSVSLQDAFGNCTVSGSNPRFAIVTAGDTARLAFAVECVAIERDGWLRVTTATTGDDLDPGYIVRVLIDCGETIVGPCEAASGAVGANDTLTLRLVAREYGLQVDDVAANCTLVASPPPPLIVRVLDTTDVTVTITCAVLPLPAGSLRVTTVTTGVDFDPQWTYVVSVAPGGGGGDVPVNGTVVLLGGYPPRDYEVGLRVASNCAVSGPNPQPVTVVAGDTADVAFAVTCAATTGIVEVMAATSGADPDSNGYAIGVDPLCDLYDCYYQWSDVVGANGTVRFVVNAGYHTVWLEDVAPNCAVSGANADTVQVVAGDTTRLTFVVTCSDLSGDLRVTAVTTGGDLDPNGYTVRVDDRAWHIVPVKGSVSVPGPWAVGEHAVELRDVASNCTVAGANPRTVTVAGGDTVDVAFAVACTGLPTTGWLRVTTATTGDELDSNGYTLNVDGLCYSEGYYGGWCDYQWRDTVGVSGTFTIPDVPLGDVTVQLQDVARNCTVAGPSTVSIVAGDTAEVTFAVTCQALGGVRVTVATSGVYLDPDGYTVRLDGGPGHATALNGAVAFSDVLAGEHTIAVEGAALNCAIDGANPRSVSVAAGDTAVVSFAVTCIASPGYLYVKWATTGVDLDRDGYTFMFDGSSLGTASVSGSSASSGVAAGDHTIGLGDVASNCVVDGINPRTVSVWPYATTAVAFTITCTSIPAGIVASVTVLPESALVVAGGSYQYRADLRDTAGNLLSQQTPVAWTSSDPAVATVSTEGLPAGWVRATGVARGRLTITASSDGVSGTAAFAVVAPVQVVTATTGVDRDLDGYDVNVDGTGAGGPERHIGPNDTISLGLAGEHLVGLVGVASNCTVSGENPRRVVATPDDETPPVTFAIACGAAGKIAFVSQYQDCVACDESSPWTTAISVMNEDGSNPVMLVGAGASDPAWSPDGARIAFARGDIWMINAAGGTPADLTNHPAWDGSPAWSPDGSKIAFSSDRDGHPELYLMNVDGSGVVRLTNTVGFEGRPTWSPDGARIAFNCRVETDNPDVCTLSSDGTGLVRLTSEPGYDHSPAWSPDGSTIAFATGRFGGASELAQMNPDGSGVRRLGAATAGDEPAWSPDGRRLAYSWATEPEPCYSFAGCRAFYVATVNADGTALIPVLGSGYSPVWRPRLPAVP